MNPKIFPSLPWKLSWGYLIGFTIGAIIVIGVGIIITSQMQEAIRANPGLNATIV